LPNLVAVGTSGNASERFAVVTACARTLPPFVPNTDAAAGELLTIKRAATALGVAPSTIHRLINDGIMAGEQIAPGAPWRIRLTDDLKATDTNPQIE
jgi:excisionase family DNA binding protein